MTDATYPTTESLAADGLRFLRAAMIRRGVSPQAASRATAAGTAHDDTARMVAQAITVVHASQRAREDATMADTSTGADLVRVANVFGVKASPGAGAQGQVLAECVGTVVYQAGLEGTARGKRYRVVTTTPAVQGDPLDVEGIDVGKATNLPAGTKLTWTSPPTGSAASAKVGPGGLTNGQEPDNEARHRARLLRRLRRSQNGGAWAHYAQWAEEASPAVDAAYVYPAAQGPGTVHVAVTIEGTADNAYARAPSPGLVAVAARALTAEQPEFADVTTTGVAHQDLSLAIGLSLPDPVLVGGAGGGWVDDETLRCTFLVGPAYTPGPVVVSSVVAANVFTVTSTYQPVGGSSVLFFDSTARLFLPARVLSSTGSIGAWVTTLDRALPTIAPGDYVSPACEAADDYLAIVQGYMKTLAPGQKTGIEYILKRASRRPNALEGASSAVTTTLLSLLQSGRPEVSNARAVAVQGLTATTLPLDVDVAPTITSAPYVWRLKRLAFYAA